MSNSPDTTPSRREVLVGQLLGLYADLGWALPTGIEYSRLTELEDKVAYCTNVLESRNAPKWSGRAIDRHEDDICAVLDAVEIEGVSYVDAVRGVAAQVGLTESRLDQLVRTWCAIAGIEVPA